MYILSKYIYAYNEFKYQTSFSCKSVTYAQDYVLLALSHSAARNFYFNCNWKHFGLSGYFAVANKDNCLPKDA